MLKTRCHSRLGGNPGVNMLPPEDSTQLLMYRSQYYPCCLDPRLRGDDNGVCMTYKKVTH